MPVLRDLLARELLMLLLLFGFGAGPASFLSKRFAAVERVALAPALGMCLATGVFTTLAYFFPATSTDWLVPVGVAASLGLALWRSRRARGWWHGRLAGWLSLVLIALVLTVPVLSVMRAHHTVGPASYAVGDAQGYVAEIDSELQFSLHHAIYANFNPNPSQRYLVAYARGYQNLDLTPVEANADALFGLYGTDSWEAFMIAFLITGALGALAVVRWVLLESGEPVRTAGGAVAGLMFGGAFFLQLLFADSQSGLCGTALLLPLGVIAADAIAEPKPRSLALVALRASGLAAVYPLFVAPASATAGCVLVYLLWRRLRAKRAGTVRDIGIGALRVALVVGLAALINLVAFTRDLRYWKALVTGGFNPATQGFPSFDMSATTIPSWLLQTRNLFTQLPWNGANLTIVAEEIVLPLAFLTIVVVAIRRFPVLFWLVITIAVAAALGEYEAAKNACSYCTDRSLLPVAPLLLGMLATGLAVLWASSSNALRAVGVVVLVAWLLPGFVAERNIRDRVTGAGTFLDPSVPALLAHVPHGATVDLEGFDSDPNQGSPDLAFAYEDADAVTHHHATDPDDVSYNNSNAYWGVAPLDGGSFDPNYQYVLTRIPGVHNARTTIARLGGIALQRRVEPLDVTVDGGEVTRTERLDPLGQAAVSTVFPLRLVVAGRGDGPAFVGVRMTAAVQGLQIKPQTGVDWRRHGAVTLVCARAAGAAPGRVAEVSVTYPAVPSTATSDPFGEPPVPVGVQLDAVAVSSGHCPFGSLRPPAQPTSTAAP